jgi:hypothetical protein
VGARGSGTVIDAADWFQFTVPESEALKVGLKVVAPEVAWRLFGVAPDGQLGGIGGPVGGGAESIRSLCPGLYFVEVMPADGVGGTALPYQLTLSNKGPSTGACATPGMAAGTVCRSQSDSLNGRSLHQVAVPANSVITIGLGGGGGCSTFEVLACLVEGGKSRIRSMLVDAGAVGTQPLVLHAFPWSPAGPGLLYVGVRPLGAGGSATAVCDASTYTVSVEICSAGDEVPGPGAMTRVPDGGAADGIDVEGIWRFGADDAFRIRRAGDPGTRWIAELQDLCESPALSWAEADVAGSLVGAAWTPCDAPGSPVTSADVVSDPSAVIAGTTRHLRLIVPTSLARNVWISLKSSAGASLRDFGLRVLKEYSLRAWPTIDRPDALSDGNDTPGSATPLTLDGAPIADRIGVHPGSPGSGTQFIDNYKFFVVDTGFPPDSPQKLTVRVEGKDVGKTIAFFLSVSDVQNDRYITWGDPGHMSDDVLEQTVDRAGPRVQIMLQLGAGNWDFTISARSGP